MKISMDDDARWVPIVMDTGWIRAERSKGHAHEISTFFYVYCSPRRVVGSACVSKVLLVTRTRTTL